MVVLRLLIGLRSERPGGLGRCDAVWNKGDALRALGWKTCRRYSTLPTLPEATRPETREARSRSHAVVFTYETPYSDTLDMVMSVQLGVELTQAFTSAFHLVDHD